MKGQKLLKVCSILMIIGGGILLLFAILAVAGVGLVAAATDLGAGLTAVAILAIILSFAGAAIELVAGIVGVKAANMPSAGKIKAALVLGILVLLISLYNSITTIVADGFGAGIFGLIIGAVLPVLYIVGVIQFKNALIELLGGGE